MTLLSTIALVLLTLVGYSSGVTLASRKQPFLPTLLDLLLVVVLWIGVFWLRGRVNHWMAIGIGLASGIILGYTATVIRLGGKDLGVDIPQSELPEHARENEVGDQDGTVFKRLWLKWSSFASDMGNVQSRLIMGFFYFIVVTPFGLATRIFSDPMKIKEQPSSSNWVAKETTDTAIESAREQG